MTIWAPEIEEREGPVYVAIAEAIAKDVASGTLPEGARLPTHRDLARRLGVTVGTVTRGYAEAERRGLTVGEVGRGTFVRSREPHGFGWRDAARQSEGGVIDMSLATPWVPPTGEDGRALARTLEEVSRSGGLDELLRYDPMSALARHRAVGAEWIGDLGLDVDPDQVVVTNGAQHAVTVTLAATMHPGDTLLVEELVYPGLKSVAQMFGLGLQGVRMDDEGIVPDALDAACSAWKARALYCVPTTQNPTSATMSARRRQEIAEVARRRDLTIVEDQIDVGPRTDRVPPIASFAPERTVLVNTLCKWATFGLRIGFVAAPPSTVERIRSGVRSSLWMAAPLMTEIAARWLADGTADEMGNRKRVELEARHALVREVFGDRFTYRTNPHSLHLWVHLPEPLRSDECVAQARQRNVLVAGSEAFAVGRDVPAAVRVSIAGVPHRQDLRCGLETLAEILEGTSETCADIL